MNATGNKKKKRKKLNECDRSQIHWAFTLNTLGPNNRESPYLILWAEKNLKRITVSPH